MSKAQQQRNEQGAESSLIEAIRLIANNFDGQYHVTIGSDDGGKVIEIRVEMKDPSAPLAEEHPSFPIYSIHGLAGRHVIFKVPVGQRKKNQKI